MLQVARGLGKAEACKNSVGLPLTLVRSTGDGTTQACRVALIYPNLDDLASPKTIISCDASGGTFSVFRATTYATGM